jgi:hypothetical protein
MPWDCLGSCLPCAVPLVAGVAVAVKLTSEGLEMPTKKVIEVFEFSELSGKSKDKARGILASGYAWSGEALDSINALAKHFGGRMVDYEIDWSNSSHSRARFDMPEMDADEIRERMKSLGSFDSATGRGNGDCVLTGVSSDEDAIDGFRMAWNENESSLDKLMQAAFESWVSARHADYEYQCSDEALTELCYDNGYQFTEDGRVA